MREFGVRGYYSRISFDAAFFSYTYSISKGNYPFVFSICVQFLTLVKPNDMYSRFDSDICANLTNTVIRFLTTIHLERVRHLLPRHFGYEYAVILLLVRRLLISLRDELMYPVSIVFTYSATYVYGVHKCFSKKQTEQPMLWTRGYSHDPRFEIKGSYCC